MDTDLSRRAPERLSFVRSVWNYACACDTHTGPDRFQSRPSHRMARDGTTRHQRDVLYVHRLSSDVSVAARAVSVCVVCVVLSVRRLPVAVRPSAPRPVAWWRVPCQRVCDLF